MRTKSRILIALCCVLLACVFGIVFSAAFVPKQNVSAENVQATPYDFTFTSAAAFVGWGYNEEQVNIDHAARTMSLKSGVAAFGRQSLGSYHTKFDLTLTDELNNGSAWYALTLRRQGEVEDYNRIEAVYSLVRDGYYLFTQGGYLQLMRGEYPNNDTYVTAGCPGGGSFFDGTARTFDITVLNEADGSVSFKVEVEGQLLIDFNTKSIDASAHYPDALTEGYMMIHSAGVASEYQGYDSTMDRRMAITDISHYDSWATADGLANQPISFGDGVYTVSPFDNVTGWPQASETTVIGNRMIGSYSAAFSAAWDPIADAAPQEVYIGMMMDEDPTTLPGEVNSWINASDLSLLTSPWYNSYVLQITASRIDLLRTDKSGKQTIVLYNPLTQNLFDGEAHDYYIGVQQSQDCADQILTLEVDGSVVFSYSLSYGKDYNGADLAPEFTEPIPFGYFQIATRKVTGSITESADAAAFMEEYFDLSFGANTGITNENGVITMPRGDHGGTGWLWQTQAVVSTSRPLSSSYAMSFTVNATKIADAAQSHMKIALNATEQYYNATSGVVSNYSIYFAPDGSMQLLNDGAAGQNFVNVANYSWYAAAVNPMDGQDHTVTVLKETENGTTRIRVFVDQKKVLDATNSDAAKQCGGYVYFWQDGVEQSVISDVSVYEMPEVNALSVSGDYKKEYKTDENLDVAGMILSVGYTNGTVQSMPVTADMVSGFDSSEENPALALTVSYAGLSASVTVSVEQGDVPFYLKPGITYKTDYAVGEAFDVSGLVICVRQEDGSYKDVAVTAEMISGFDSSLGAEGLAVTITYEGDSVQIFVNIVKAAEAIAVKEGYTAVYKVGSPLDYGSLFLTVSYDDGTTAEVPVTGAMVDVHGVAEGENLVYVSYEGMECSFTVTGSGDDWDANGDGEIRDSLASINIADPTAMDFMTAGGSVIRSGNVFRFGNTASMYKEVAAVSNPADYRVEFQMSIPSSAADGNLRFGLRFNADGDINDKEGKWNGYYLIFYKNSVRVHRNYSGSSSQYGYLVAVESFTESNVGFTDIYDGKIHSYEFEIFDRDENTVVINVMIDGVHLLQFADDGSLTDQLWGVGPIPEADRQIYKSHGRFSVILNDSAMLTIVGGANEESISENTYFGDDTMWKLADGSSAEIQKGGIDFTGADSAVVSAAPYGNVSALFYLEPESVAGEEWIFAVGLRLQGEPSANVLKENDWQGYGIYLFADRAEIRVNGVVRKTLNGLKWNDSEPNEVAVSVINVEDVPYISLGMNGQYLSYADETAAAVVGAGLIQLAINAKNVRLDAASEEYIPFRVLFIGNSITSCAPNTDEGWNVGGQDWGMAVDDKEKDYVHLVMSMIRSIKGYEDAEYMIAQAAGFERAYATYDYITEFAAQREFGADLIIGRISENANSNDASYVNSNPFSIYYGKLIDYLNPKDSDVILTTSYWGTGENYRDSAIDAEIIRLAQERNYPLVRLGDLGSTFKDENDARADAEYYAGKTEDMIPSGAHSWAEEFDGWSSGVLGHPGINGMKNIAARIFESVEALLTGGDPYIQKFESYDCGITVEYTDSDLTEDAVGAYAGTPLTSVAVSEFADGSEQFRGVEGKLGEGVALYRLFNVQTDGDLYRLTLELKRDVDARFSFRFYTLADGDASPVEFSEYVLNVDTTNDPTIAMQDIPSGWLAVCIEVDYEEIFRDMEIDDNGEVLEWVNRGLDYYLFDLTSLSGYNSITIKQSFYASLISAGQDLEIRFENGVIFRIDRQTLEAILQMSDDLYISAQYSTSERYRTNAKSAAESLGNYTFVSADEEGRPSSVLDFSMRKNSRTGTPLYVNQGIAFILPFDAENTDTLALITAELSPIRDEFSRASVEDGALTYADGYLTIRLKDFSKLGILAEYPVTQISVNSTDHKVAYKVGDSLDVTGLTISVVYGNGYTETVAVTADMVSGFDSSEAGEEQLTVAFGGMETTYQVTVEGEGDVTPPDDGKDPGDDKDPGPGDDKGGCAGAVGGASFMAAAAVLFGAVIAIGRRKNNRHE